MNIGGVLSILSGIMVVFFFVRKKKELESSNPNSVSIYPIRLWGVLSFLFALIARIIVLVDAFDLIEEVGSMEITKDNSLSLVAGVLKSIVAGGIYLISVGTIIGTIFLISSIILWWVIKSKKLKKISTWKE